MPPTPHLLVLRHGPLVGPDRLVPSLDGRADQLSWRAHDCTEDPALPPLDGVAGLLVLGGLMGVHDDDPWLEPERTLLREAVDRGVPVLGICLGAQQLGVALGGEVTRLPATNIALADLTRTGAGREHEVVAGWPDGAPALFHHDDAVSTLPEGATVLLEGAPGVTSAWCDDSDTALAVQFHPEASPATVRAWQERRAAASDGEVDEDFLARVEAAAPFTAAAGTALVLRWVDARVLPRA